MCGIIGYAGEKAALPILIDGLERMQYRGYDSAGIALESEKKIHVLKSSGKLDELKKIVKNIPAETQHSTIGIGHTRWATHGKPNTQNAHPHKIEHIVLVHNGIIENYTDLKSKLQDEGLFAKTETDTEIFGLLILSYIKKNYTFQQAVIESFIRLKGQCSAVVMSEQEPDVLIAIRNGSPLILAHDITHKGVFFASDIQALLSYTNQIVFLEDFDCVVTKKQNTTIYNLQTKQYVTRSLQRIDWSNDQLHKNGFEHFMLKEIFEQPIAVQKTLQSFLNAHSTTTTLLNPKIEALCRQHTQFLLIACGTSYHAALLGKYWIEQLTNIPVIVEVASEFRYRKVALHPSTLLIGISQSGETADTLSVINDMRKKGYPTLGICNVQGSSLERSVDFFVQTMAGPEIGVASTKAFITQLAVLLSLAYALSGQPSHMLFELAHQLNYFLQNSLSTMIQSIIPTLKNTQGFFFIGRGFYYPLALEGALKLKEIAYDHAEGYPAGELKHGPIAMLDKNMTVIVIAPTDQWRAKTFSNLQEVKARQAKIISIGLEDDKELQDASDHFIALPNSLKKFHPEFFPFFITPALQLFSYYRALEKGTNIDQPRNLAKSVTVE